MLCTCQTDDVSLFACVSSFSMCFLTLQCCELSEPPYKKGQHYQTKHIHNQRFSCLLPGILCVFCWKDEAAGPGFFQLLQTAKCWKWVAFWCVRLKGFSTWILSRLDAPEGCLKEDGKLKAPLFLLSLPVCQSDELTPIKKKRTPTLSSLNLNVGLVVGCMRMLCVFEGEIIPAVFYRVILRAARKMQRLNH